MRKEQPLPKYGTCNLGSINLSEFVKNPFTPAAYFDFVDFKKVTAEMVRYLDEIIDKNLENHALPEQREMIYNYRNIGLGVTGLHDALIKMRIKYGTDHSLKLANGIMDQLFRAAFEASVQLAKEKGAFPKYSHDLLKATIVKKHFTPNHPIFLEAKKYGLRNCSLLSIAPTGSIGSMLNVSTGCEPVFAMSYTRKTESLNNNIDTYYKVYTGVVREYIEKFETEELPEYFTESKDISWRDRIDMQGVLQTHIDTAISSTINLPHDIPLEEIEQLYLYAWEKGLKGVTIYRDSCKRAGILSTSNSEQSEKNENAILSEIFQIPRGFIIKADDNCIGKKRTLTTGCGTLHCEAFFDPDSGSLLETYLSKGSSGGCNQFMIGLSRLISLAARGGIDIESIVDQLRSSGTCPSYAVRRATQHDTSLGSSCPVAVGNALMDMYDEIQEELGLNNEECEKKEINLKKESDKKITSPNEHKLEHCPECGSASLTPQEGCFTCQSCGWTKCSS